MVDKKEIGEKLFTMANELAGEETGHLAAILHSVSSELMYGTGDAKIIDHAPTQLQNMIDSWDLELEGLRDLQEHFEMDGMQEEGMYKARSENISQLERHIAELEGLITTITATNDAVAKAAVS